MYSIIRAHKKFLTITLERSVVFELNLGLKWEDLLYIYYLLYILI